jgi:hypothetical protein
MRERSWVLVDHWEADLFAIGVARKGDERRLPARSEMASVRR